MTDLSAAIDDLDAALSTHLVDPGTVTATAHDVFIAAQRVIDAWNEQ